MTGSHDFVYVHADIPAGMTVREWRAERAASRSAPTRPPLLAAVRRLEPATRMWHARSRALAGPRIARVRVRDGRRRAPRPAAPPNPRSHSMTMQPEPSVDRGFERRLKRRDAARRLCSRRTREGMAGGRGRLSPAPA